MQFRQNVKISFGMNSIVHQGVQKWNKWPRLAKTESVMKALNDFLLSQHENFL